MAYWIATFAGAGLSKIAPGTVGSVASLVIWSPLVLLHVVWPIRLALVLLVFALGWWATWHGRHFFSDDDPRIVVDEVAGMGLTLCFCAASIASIALGFALFRFFDILKPWPIGLADRRIKGSFGIMLDDLIAGAMAMVILEFLEPWLLSFTSAI